MSFLGFVFLLSLSYRYTLPVTEGKANVTILDTQIRKLRSRFLSQIHEAALRMRSEATDVKSTLLEIEEWLDKLMQLTEEVDLGITLSSVPRRILQMTGRVGEVVGGASGTLPVTGIGSDQ